MNRNKLLILVVIALGLAVFGIAGSVPNQASASNPTPIVANYYLSNFSVKFVCGETKGPIPALGDAGEGLVKPGNYATEINIHNYWYREVGIRKKVVVLALDPGDHTLRPFRARETNPHPDNVAPQPQEHYRLILPPDGATMDDCTALWQMAYPGTVPPTPMPLFIGYLVLLSPLDLDVDAVYTAESLAPGATGDEQSTGMSIDVERVNGKRVYCPPTLPICVSTQPGEQIQEGDPNVLPDD
jgi:hypothetical protein